MDAVLRNGHGETIWNAERVYLDLVSILAFVKEVITDYLICIPKTNKAKMFSY